MESISLKKDIHWVPKPNTVEIFISDKLPDGVCSSAYVFAFDGDRLLMADLDRGIDIPGGHIDEGEDPDTAMRREAREETGAIIGTARLFAYQKITLLGPKPDGYNYPYPDSYQLMYFSNDFEMGTFTTDDDSRGPIMIDPAAAENTPWVQKNKELYEYAFNLAKEAGMKPQHKTTAPTPK